MNYRSKNQEAASEGKRSFHDVADLFNVPKGP